MEDERVLLFDWTKGLKGIESEPNIFQIIKVVILEEWAGDGLGKGFLVGSSKNWLQSIWKWKKAAHPFFMSGEIKT